MELFKAKQEVGHFVVFLLLLVVNHDAGQTVKIAHSEYWRSQVR